MNSSRDDSRSKPRSGPRFDRRSDSPGTPRPAPIPIDPTAPPPLGDAARDLAFRRLARQAVRYPEMEIAGLDDTHASVQALSERDAAFAHAIYDAGVRRWLTLHALLAPLATQPIEQMEARLRGALVGSAAQIMLLDRVPVHAVINHAVEWCKQRIRPGAGAMANAVLRRFAAIVLDEAGQKRRRDAWTNQRDEVPLSDGGALVLSSACLPEDEIERAGVAASYPADLLRSWLERVPIESVLRLARHGLATPPTILNVRSRVTKTGAGDAEFDAAMTAHESAWHAVFTGARSHLRQVLAARADVWVQDPAASGAVESIVDLKIDDGVILDLCAGQGTKTRQLVKAFPKAVIYATDVDANRRETLAKVFGGNERVRVMPPKQVRQECLERADLVLLDVPCSNTGVLARRPEAKYRYSKETIESLAGVQRQVIADTIPLLSRAASGVRKGMILYSTCSLETAENEAMSAWARQWHQFEVTRERREWPTGGPGEAGAAYRDGAYSVLLR